MPTCQFVNQARKISVTRDIATPKRIGELRYWLKACQAVIPQIPRVIAESEMSADRSIGNDGWFVCHSDADIKWIKFHLENRIGEKADIVINRQSGALRR